MELGDGSCRLCLVRPSGLCDVPPLACMRTAAHARAGPVHDFPKQFCVPFTADCVTPPVVFPLCSLANARDVGEWLGASGHATFNFAPGVRPVPLEIHMHGLDIHNFEARMQVSMAEWAKWLLLM